MKTELNAFQECVVEALEGRLRFLGRRIEWRRVVPMKASTVVRVLIGRPSDSVLEMGIDGLKVWIYTDGCELARGGTSRSFERADFDSLDELRVAFVAAVATELATAT